MDRRSFLHNLSHVTAGTIVLPTFAQELDFLNSDSYLSNTLAEGKILILVKLNGGNDGLNTLIPMDQLSQLNQARPHVILPENSLINLGSNDLGLHPELNNFKSLFDEDRLKIIQNVGYSSPDFSHFRSMDIFESGSRSDQYINSGWIGRYLEDIHPNYPEGYPNQNYPHPLSIEINQTSLLTTGNSSFTSYVINNPRDFFQITNELNNNYQTINNLGIKLDYIQMVAKQSNFYGEIIRDKYVENPPDISYGNSELDNQFEVVNRLIKGRINTRIYMVELAGFDTHDSQVDSSDKTRGVHANLLRQLNDSIGTFMRNMDEINRSDDVLVMTYSEFGRTIVSNGSNGTDHGSAAPLFIFGNKVDPTILGSNPNIPQNAVWQDNLESEFDFKQIYSSIINQWLSVGENRSANVLFNEFDQLQIIGSQYIDSDGDGVSDDQDQCDSTPLGTLVDTTGCAIFSLPPDNYTIQTNGVSCTGKTNGQINISSQNTSHVYTVTIPETNASYLLNSENSHQVQIEDLSVGTYTLNITVQGEENYIQTYEIGIIEPGEYSAKTSVDFKDKIISVKASGSEMYLIEVNDEISVEKSQRFKIKLNPGYNKVKISTPHDCQGVYEEEIFISEQVEYYPNPVVDYLNIVIPGKDTSTIVELYDRSGTRLKTDNKTIPFSRVVKVNTVDLSKEIYIVKVKGDTVDQTFKIQK